MCQIRMRKSLMFLWIVVMVLSYIPMSYGKGETEVIYIHTKEDLIQFARACGLDTYSTGKSIELTSDIDLEGEVFLPIPIFNGVFDGKGYTISGINIEQAGSIQGFFRYVKPEGVIKNVNFEGNILPKGTQSIVGGVVGSNEGLLENVTFTGTVRGKEQVGGLVGKNLETGRIVTSSTEGDILADKMVGGVVGENLGAVTDVINLAEVNTVVEETLSSVEGASFELEDSQQLVERYTDIGGVAGYSSGIIQNAINKGEIGYPHVGYNIGGIVGRQSGYIQSSTNEGDIYGRKDVGGIVGHAEPHITLSLSEDLLDRLETELNALHQLIGKTLSSVDVTSKETSQHLSNIAQYTSSATGHTHTLFDQTTEFVDDNIEQVNQISEIITSVIEELIPIMETLEKSSESMTEGINEIERAFNQLEEAIDESEEISEHIEKAIKDLRYANDDVYDAVNSIRMSMEAFKQALVMSDEQGVMNTLQQLSLSIRRLAEEVQILANCFENIRAILESLSGLEDLENEQGLITAYLKDLISTLENMGTLFLRIGSHVIDLSANSYLEWKLIQEGLEELGVTMEELQKVSRHMEDAYEHLIDGFEPMENMTDALGKAMRRMMYAMRYIQESGESTTSTLEQITVLITNLSEEEPIVFVELGDTYRLESEALYKSIDSIATEVEGLNRTITGRSEALNEQMGQINSQFNVIMGILLEAVEQIPYIDEKMNPLNQIEDFSDETIEETILGKILDAVNRGKVEADHNVGGIAGVMAIEYGLNHELDLNRPSSFNYTYQTRTIVQRCKNEGDVIAKKDYSGGIVGRMYTGIVVESENYGLVKSTYGDYVGGVAGGSETIIRSSFSKNTLEGRNYVGGIVGIGSSITDSYSNVQILSGEENIGAIAGGLMTHEIKIENNYFMSQVLEGIDQVSYTNQAEPVSYEEIVNHTGIPEDFLSFNITFISEDIVQTQIPVVFGEKVENIILPQLPEKKGFYSYWEPIEEREVVGDLRVEGIYKPWVTMIGSETSRQDELSLVLVEGQFKEDVQVKVTERIDLKWEGESNHIAPPIYHIALENAEIGHQEEVSIRLLNEEETDVTVWVYQNNKWHLANTEHVGKYILTSMQGQEGIFCLVPKDEELILKMVGGVLGIGIIMLIGRKCTRQLSSNRSL